MRNYFRLPFMRDTTNNLPVGTHVDRYIIRKNLGGGGFSIVYLAEEIETGKPVVIKEYMPGRMAKRMKDHSVIPISEEKRSSFLGGRKLFFQEASILATLKHENIVNVLNFFRANGTIYMVMEYEKGRDLQHYISKNSGHLGEEFLLSIFLPLLGALETIHEQGFFHQDIKPGNIHVLSGLRPLLLDFGAVQRKLVSRIHNPGQVTSTGFSPVEQYQKNGYIGPWTDIYAIGATMRTCIEGRPPQDAMERYTNDKMVPATTAFRKKYSPELLKMLDWTLEIDPELRPQSISELRPTLPVLRAEIPSLGSRLLARIPGLPTGKQG
jgi:serine/threonine protein kinase